LDICCVIFVNTAFRNIRPRWKLYAFRNIRQQIALHDADLNSYCHIERKNRKREVLTLTKMLVYAVLSTNLGSNLLILKKMVEKTWDSYGKK
jgi:hypothetical protein